MKFVSSRSLACALFGASLLVVLASCSNQAEGERCDLANGNQDCESGLECKTLQSLSGRGEGAICCPDENPSVPECRLNNLGNLDPKDPGTTGPMPTGTTGPMPTSSVDAGSDAGVDSGAP